MDVFAEDGLKFFGIDKKVKELGPTELVVLESKNLHMDYTFLMEDDTYIHFEFQTTNKNISDLRRFRAYEALLAIDIVFTLNLFIPVSKVSFTFIIFDE